MSAQFTPGPWRTGPAHVVRQQSVDGHGRRVTRFVAEAVLSAPFVEGERDANARLIAAAPELYEAPGELLGMLPRFSADLHPVFADAVRSARAALAKARGEQ